MSVISDWEQQLIEIAEAEKWEGCLYKIPSDLQTNFKLLLDKFGIQQRISTYKLLSVLDWADHYCRSFYDILLLIQVDKVGTILELWNRYSKNAKLLSVVTELLLRFTANLTTELLTEFTYAEKDELFDIFRFLTLHEMDLMVQSMVVMKIRGFSNLLKICNEPSNKQCRLCKTKRILALEYKMIQSQLPKDEIPLLGTLVLHETVQNQWTADDDMGYVFDAKSGSVFYHKQLVDIVRICDNCLQELHRSISSECRFAEFHHLDVKVRKVAIKDLRQKELARAELIHILAIERDHRRAKEVAIKALHAHKHGVRLEKEEEEKLRKKQEREAFLQNEKIKREEFISKAMIADSKWKRQEANSNATFMQELQVKVNINLHPGFGDHNPVSTAREHPYSWQLQHYDTSSSVQLMSQSNNLAISLKTVDDKIGGKSTFLPMIKPDVSSNSKMVANNMTPLISPSNVSQSSKHARVHNQQPLPLTEAAAAQRFGLSSFVPDIRYGELSAWKLEAESMHEQHLRKLELEAELKRIEEKKQYEERIDYVHDRVRGIHRRKQQEIRHQEQAEVDRIEKRKDDRVLRKAIRIAGYEARERGEMEAEDIQGWWMRYHANEYLLYTQERENMFNEEMEQTEIDRFWGLLTAHEEHLAEIERKNRAYADKVEEMRVKCVHAHIIKPYTWEAKAKKFHDVFTHEVIT